MFWGKSARFQRGALAALLIVGGCATPEVRNKSTVVSPTAPPLPSPPVVVSTVPAERPLPSPPAVVSTVPAERPSTVPIGELKLWSYIGTQLSLPRKARKEIRAELAWFKSNRDYMERVSERAAPYLYFVTQALQERGLPLDLALLPIIESAYQPQAHSSAGARGLWQFIPSTGRMFGLEQTWWYDGRSDVVSATLAALDYLSILHRKFDGDWLLALAAYNCGEAAVSRAIKRNKRAGKAIDFWSLELPRETEAYVPRLLAAAIIVADPARFEIRMHPVPNEPYFAEIDLGQQTDLTKAAQIASVREVDFKLLNPGFRRLATPPDGPHTVLVPIPNADRLKRGIASLPPEQRLTWGTHRIKPGDTLGHIAERYGTSVAALQRWNKLRGTLIRVGRTLAVPPLGKAGQTTQAIERQGTKRVYAVRSGDTLSHIAQAYRVSVSQLVAWNKLSQSDLLYPRQQLEIWSSQSTVADPNQVRIYNVRPGDSLWRIARRFKISVADLRRWNRLASEGLLHPGQQLLLASSI